MTPAQKFRLYFPAWHAVVKANGWHMEQRRLVIDGDRLGEEGRQVVAAARQRAACEFRGPVRDDLRHGAHVVALGGDKSSADLTNDELDRVLTLFALLADPQDLAARLRWDAYLRGENPGAQERTDWFIQHAAPGAYARAIAADKFGTRQWENLDLGRKKNLAITLARRRANRERSLPAGVPSADEDPDWSVA